MTTTVLTLRAEPELLAALDHPAGWAALGPTVTASHRVRQVLRRWAESPWPCEAEPLRRSAGTGRRTIHLDDAAASTLARITAEWKVSNSAALRLVLLGFLAQADVPAGGS